MTDRQMSRSRASRAGLSRLVRVARRAAVPAVGALALLGVTPALASASSGGWQLNGVGLSEVIHANWKGTMKLTSKVPIFGSEAVQCEEAAEGTVGAGGVGEVTKWTMSKCAAVTTCETKGAVVVTPLNLPWHTELAVVEGSIRDRFVSGGKGTPGYKIECKILGGISEDTCIGTIGTTTTNVTGGVTAAFNAGEKLKCSYDEGTNSGTLEGSQSVTASGGGTLSTGTETSAVWRNNFGELGGASAINWKKGRLALSDRIPVLGEVGVECEDAGSGAAGANGKGEVTEWTPSKCVKTSGGRCESAEAIEALNLPWHTELVFSEGKTREVITSGGKGTPGFKLKCKAAGETIADECPVASPTMKNTENGVSETFGSFLSCTEGSGGEALLEGGRTLKLTNGELLRIA
jgi:hypothetical protein